MIKLTVYQRPEPKTEAPEVVRLTSEAAVKLVELQRLTGLPAKHIVSEILLQAAEELVIEEV